MMKILIFSGTTEGRQLSELLARAKISHGVSVATEYGELVMQENPFVTIYQGRLSQDAMQELILRENYQIVVDATHPYAIEVTKTILSCVGTLQNEKLDITYLRLERNTQVSSSNAPVDLAGQDKGDVNSAVIRFEGDSDRMRFFADNETCVKELEKISGNILLTTGSKELPVYCESSNLKERLFARVLPGLESLIICKEQGLLPKQILALQGPFGVELNEALIHQYQISCMVTKQGGINGGFPEKQEAARRAGIPLFVIQREESMEDEKIKKLSFTEVCRQLEQLIGKILLDTEQADLQITLAGIGMGSHALMTVEVQQAIAQADLIVGAERVIAPFTSKLEKKSIYLPEEIFGWLKEKSVKYEYKHSLNVAVLFSGDSGFYSGCQKVQVRLKTAMEKKEIHGTIKVCPGISSVQAMAAACSISWQNAGIYSIHGRTDQPHWKEELLWQVKKNKTLFLLVSGAKDIQMLGNILDESCEVLVGYQLSYPDEEILTLTPEQCKEVKKEGLYIAVIQKKETYRRNLTPHLTDEAFIRGKVPMTKEEIRQISICKLQLQPDSVVYDVGSGTGSIAVEVAGLSNQIKVYAIEKKEEAVELLQKNKEKFGRCNIEIRKGKAPDAFQGLDAPTHAFIGGSGGNLFSILTALWKQNKKMRIVLNAVSLETLAELEQIRHHFFVKNWELVQIQVSRYRELGSYLMPKAENPIFICSFEFQDGVIENES